MYLNIGTPNNHHSPFGTNGEAVVVGVPILKHFRVLWLLSKTADHVQTVCLTVLMWNVYGSMKKIFFFSPETQSDQSDFEGKIRALNEELRRRKAEADKLKRERKKKRKELMKNKEESLKKQIEVICIPQPSLSASY